MNKVITRIPEKDQQVYRFFSTDYPCYFEGCQELRDRYNQEIENLEKKNCKDCDKIDTIKKFKRLVRTALEKEEYIAASQRS
jgi:hypothetical protein